MILHQKTILQNLSEAECYREVLDAETLERIWALGFSGGKVRKNKLGNIFISGEVVNKAYDLIRDQIPVQADMYGGNFFIACHHYGPHMDSFHRQSEVDDGTTVYKNVIVPLWIGGSDKGDNITFYKQRLIDYGSAFGGKPEFNKERKHQLHPDPTVLQYYDDTGQAIPKEQNRKDFDVERVFEWRPGDLIVFDSVQVHSSERVHWVNKMGLLLKFRIKFK